MLQKIDELKSQPIVGNYYLVPCIIKEERDVNFDWVISKESELVLEKEIILYIYPIINHRHSDKENGQDYEHYHVDYRFIELQIINNKIIPTRKNRNHTFAPHLRYNIYADNKDFKIEYHKLRCLRLNNYGIGGPTKNSKLKHKCIHKGKCPHRGYDLSQEPTVNGVITCPLHGLQFNSETKQLLTFKL
jgi:hypothetical protein